MPIISPITIKEVSERTDLAALAGEYMRLEKRGGEWWGCCPFHNEKSPSFHIMSDRNRYYCFGCQATGDSITFFMEIEKLSFTESITALAHRSGVEVLYEGGFVPESAPDNRTEYIDLYTRVASSFHFLLVATKQGKDALAYITSRGIDNETITRFSIGYAPADRRWLKQFLRSKNYSDSFLANSGLFSKKYPDVAFFSHRLMFPIFDRQGRVVAFGGRALAADEERKYLNSSDLPMFKKGESLYAFNFARKEIGRQNAVIFCEGYMDVLAYHQCGITNAVAPLGTALTREQVHLVRTADTVFLSFDGDGAGKSATQKAILLCRSEKKVVRIIRMNGGKDPAEIMQKYGKEHLSKCVENAIIDYEYLLSELKSEYQIDTPDGKIKAALAFFSYIDVLEADIQKQSCLDMLSQTLGLSSETVQHDYRHRDAAQRKIGTEKPASQQGEKLVPIKLNAELRTMLSVIVNSQFFSDLRAAVTADDFEDVLARDMFFALEECYRQEAVSISGILSKFSDENVRQLINNAAMSGEYKNYSLDAIEDSIRLIHQNSLARRRQKIMNEIRSLKGESLDGRRELEALLSEKMSIDSELNK